MLYFDNNETGDNELTVPIRHCDAKIRKTTAYTWSLSIKSPRVSSLRGGVRWSRYTIGS